MTLMADGSGMMAAFVTRARQEPTTRRLSREDDVRKDSATFIVVMVMYHTIDRCKCDVGYDCATLMCEMVAIIVVRVMFDMIQFRHYRNKKDRMPKKTRRSSKSYILKKGIASDLLFGFIYCSDGGRTYADIHLRLLLKASSWSS